MANHYKISTLLYGLVALLGCVAIGISAANKEWLLLVISLLAVLVAVDNFFCATRAKVAGHSVEGHYTVPPFLKRKRPGKTI